MGDAVLHAPDFLWGYRCNQRGCCCGPWKVGLREEDFHRLRLALKGTELEGEVGAAVRLKTPTPFASLLPSSNQVARFGALFGSIDKGPDGTCVFLAEDARCRVHAAAGEEALPDICRNFPIAGYETPDGAMAFWDLLCPEVANLLASTREPARITPMPGNFERATFLFRPANPEEVVSLTAELTAPFATYVAFRRAVMTALAVNHEGPLLPLAGVLAHVQRWVADPAMTTPLGALPVDETMYAVLLNHLAQHALDAEAQVATFRGKVPFARRFFAHHSWGEVGVLDVLEGSAMPSVEAALGALADAEDAVHVVLTNYLTMKLWGVPLVQQGTIEGGLAELLRRLGTALYVAGGLTRVDGGALSAEHLVAALAFADVVYRVNATSPRPPRLDVRPVAQSPTGRLDDLLPWTANQIRA